MNISLFGRAKIDQRKATEVSGVKTVLWLSDFDRIFQSDEIEA